MRAAAAIASSKGGKGPAIEGPYLDLRTGKGNQMAYARIQGDIDFGKQKYFWFKGYVNAVQPGKRIVDLVGAQGFGAIRLIQRPDGAIERLCREIILYTDLRSGEVLKEWSNSLTGETVKAVHVDNDPVQLPDRGILPAAAIVRRPQQGRAAAAGPPFVLPWYQHGDWLEMEIHIHLAYPNALQPDKWPRESSGPTAQVSEYFAHHIRGRGHAESKAHHARLPGHLEPRDAVAAVDAHGPGAGVLPVQLLHGQRPPISTRSSRRRCSITPRRITRSTSTRRKNGPVSPACRAWSTTRARRNQRRRNNKIPVPVPAPF